MERRWYHEIAASRGGVQAGVSESAATISADGCAVELLSTVPGFSQAVPGSPGSEGGLFTLPPRRASRHHQGMSDLSRFLDAQQREYPDALRELRAGKKEGHWIWYVFPQLRGLGKSTQSQTFGIESREEATAYLAHPVLGERLRESTRAVLAHRDSSLGEMFGETDAMKFRSSMTLFAAVAEPKERLFEEALEAFCDGTHDQLTQRILEARD